MPFWKILEGSSAFGRFKCLSAYTWRWLKIPYLVIKQKHVIVKLGEFLYPCRDCRIHYDRFRSTGAMAEKGMADKRKRKTGTKRCNFWNISKIRYTHLLVCLFSWKLVLNKMAVLTQVCALLHQVWGGRQTQWWASRPGQGGDIKKWTGWRSKFHAMGYVEKSTNPLSNRRNISKKPEIFERFADVRFSIFPALQHDQKNLPVDFSRKLKPRPTKKIKT